MGDKTADTIWILAIDLIIINFIFLVTLFIRFGNTFYDSIYKYLFFTLFVSLVYLISLLIFYDFEYESLMDTIINTGKVCFIASILIAAVAYFDWTFRIPRTVIGILFCFSFPILSMTHITLLQKARKRVNTIIIGEDIKLIKAKYNIIGFLSDKRKNPIGNLPCLGRIEELRRIIKKYRIRNILLALPKKETDKILNIILLCHDLPVKVKAPQGLYDFLPVNPNGTIIGENLVDVTISPQSLFERIAKRLFDIGFAVFGIIITSPLWITIPFFIILDSKGPILFKQTRTTRYNKPFKLYKFRSMVKNAEKTTGPVITDGKKDARITRLGRFLRKYYLDEIPQFINILRGDMSVVGPRPERPIFNKKFSKNMPWPKRIFIRPGLTGMAQINDITGLQPEEKLKFDLYYMKNQNFFLDIKIVIRQILKMFS